MHYLSYVVKEVDKTHPGLGSPVAVAMLTVKAKKLLLMVSPRGCGKSRITTYVGFGYPQHSIQDRLSVAGLSYMAEEFTGFTGVVVVDDLAKTQTPYARIATMTTLAELVYSHYCHSRLQGSRFDITGFGGAALVNIQPVILKSLVTSPEWEASMQDKSIRYYHLHRPLRPNPEPPKLTLEWGIALDKVLPFKLEGKLADRLMRIGESQWGLARMREHTTQLLRAAAALDSREVVNQSDYILLIKLLTPMLMELLVTYKRHLETDRVFRTDRLALLTEYFTYGDFTLKNISSDYKVSEATAYRIMATQVADWALISKHPTTYTLSEAFKNEIRGLGINV